MKKFVIALIALIAILAVVLFLKMNGNILTNSSSPVLGTSPTRSFDYSSEDIANLILKGQEVLDNADSVYYERHVKGMLFKHYYKGSKEKYESYQIKDGTTTKLITAIKNYDNNTQDLFYHLTKTKSTIRAGYPGISLQEFLVTYVKNKDYYKTDFIYIKDERIEEKDCIFIKVLRHNTPNNEIKTSSKGLINVYWIEKLTGFLVGSGEMQPDSNTSTPITIIKNLSFGTVKDSDFIEPAL